MPQTSDSLAKLFALKYLHSSTSKYFSEDVVDWAVSQLVAGNSTESMSILAGLTPPIHWQELDYYFQRALDESGLAVPPREECLRTYAQAIAADIVSGAIGPIKGCRVLYHIGAELDYPPDFGPWFSLDDDLEWRGYTQAEAEQEIIREARIFIAPGTGIGSAGGGEME